MNILIIANPVSSGVDIRKKALRLAGCLEERGHAPQIYLTRYRGDARHKISSVNNTIDRVVVVGGDGTFNEVLNGIPMDLGIPITQLPAGNANLLGKDLNLPTRCSAMADLLENGKIVQADLAEMNGSKFIMVADVGFGARVTEEMKKNRRGKVNNFSYLLPIFRALGDLPRIYEVCVDETHYAKGAMVLVSNVRTYAGICTVAHTAGIDTGVLDVVVLPQTRAKDLINYMAHIYFGKLHSVKGVQYLKGKKISIQCKNPMPVQLDGDFFGRHEEVNIELSTTGYPILVP